MERIKLKLARIEAGYTQKTFAEAIGMAQSNYLQIEKGRVDIKNTTIKKILETLNKKYEDIF